MGKRVSGARGIQTGPFAALYADFVQETFQLYHFILGGQLLLLQRTNNGKREFFQPQKRMGQRVSSAWGIQTGPFAAF